MTILPAKHKKTSSKHSSVKSLGESEKRDSIPASDWSDEAVECREEQKDTHQQGGLNVPRLDASTCIQKFEYHEGSPLNGIISYLTGTGVSMKNVHRKGVVEVTASSWAKSPYNAVEFWTDSVFSSKNEPNSWIRYDFKNRRVTPTSYSIGSYSGSYNPKSWVFEVSNDGSEGSWEVLDQRDNSSDLCEKNVTRNFPIISVPDRSFRFIRVRQTGVNNGHVPNDYLVIASLEVFGTLFQPTRPVSSPGIFAFDDLNPLMGIISHLNREFGGSLDQKGVVTVTASSHKVSHEAYNALETITKPFFCFESKDKPNSWIRYDFKKRRVRPTGYSIHSGEDGCYLRTWVFEVSNNKSEWQVVDWQNNYGDLSDKFFIRHFTLTVPPLESFRFIRLRQTGKNSSDSDILTFTCLEIFGTLEQA